MGYINKELVLSGLNLRLIRLKNEHENDDKIAELENIIGAISETETEDVAPVIHARWVTWKSWYTCSNCDCMVDKKTNYCENCGAKMDKE